MNTKSIAAVGVLVLGILIVISAAAHPPAGECPVIVGGDPGSVHLNADGTIDYYDNCRLYPYALQIFITITGVGILLTGTGVWSLVKHYR
jgi:hypothetical protein